ncbi:ATP-dependent 6-phosphofructokinase [Hydrocarboniphaga effusa]|uniref:ATP-dependent 6-phosphofructokinase n=1 Tax=Hydrocarboniphaga effusa TaxID=243629 RepID=UPI003137F294
MINPTKTVGVLTSGGDCAGLNAVIGAVTRHAVDSYGWRVLGITDGTLGLTAVPRQYCELRPERLSAPLLHSGGSFLGSISHGEPGSGQQLVDRKEAFADGARKLGLDALVAIGGDGSMRILHELCSHARLPMIGIPKTIDNDVPETESAVGFASAVQVVSDALDRLQPTAASHHRVIVVETMGRSSGHIALHGGLCGGADAILVPELRMDVESLIAHIRRVFSSGRRHALIVVAEGVRAQVAGLGPYESVGTWLAQELEKRSGIEARCTSLGYLQRGGSPCAEDRRLAAIFGLRAVELLANGNTNRMVCWTKGAVLDVPLKAVITGPRKLEKNSPLLAAARGLGIWLGDDADAAVASQAAAESSTCSPPNAGSLKKSTRNPAGKPPAPPTDAEGSHARQHPGSRTPSSPTRVG